ncbi:metallophosphoesterase [uncultured Methanobrevibacter sp.]|uniref:metallophosphoesterase n=1 Tax=uncultured Methanobrevibacter sp. TaxID=253161 RepID=UPI0025E7B871|nr:metallophosphoesterase [uncultured Methanobrevibacter sp.]
MSHRTRRIIGTAPFLGIFYFFLIKYTFLLFGGLNDWVILFISLILVLLHILPTLFEERKSRFITRVLANIYGIIQWLSVMYLIEVVLIYIICSFINLKSYILALLMIVPLIGIYAYYHAHIIVIKEKNLTFDNLKEEISVAHISDLHYGFLMNNGAFNRLKNALVQLEGDVDLVIISGDLADGSSVINEDDFKALSEINIPIIFTPGNHDYYPGIDNVKAACKKANIIILDNESMEFKGLNIFGYSFSYSNTPCISSDELYNYINQDKVNIIIYHTPKNWETFTKIGFDLQLSGHTHGGQFHPGIFFSELVFKYNKGLFENNMGDKKHYLSVTTGVGVMDIPMRWGTDSEIVILRFKRL